MLPVAILAGGLATRLGPMAQRTPKALIPVAGRPFLRHQLELLRSQGARRIVLCVGHLGEQISAAIGRWDDLELDIGCVSDGPALRGTGGALKNALPALGARFLVLNGDSYLRCPLERIAAAFSASSFPALMTVLRNEGRWERSNVLMREGQPIRYDKHVPLPGMAHVDYGLCAFTAEAFDPYPAAQPLDLADVCRDLSVADKLEAYEVAGRFYEVGSPQGIRDTEAHLAGAA